jgi:16S rRNA (guanine527-N7)-methyltransferase
MTNRDSKRELRLSCQQIAATLAPFGVGLTGAQLAAIESYVRLLLSWNASINLTALEDPLEIVTRHFGESVFATSVIPMRSGRLADVGSGAGFPGMALKIAIPELDVVLIESNRKKCAFLAEVKQSLGLERVDIIRERYEEWPAQAHSVDFLCSRALGNYRHLLRWSQSVLKSGGKAVLWLGTDDSTLVGNTLGWDWAVPTPIPDSRRRVLLVGSPRNVPRGT